MSTTNKWVVVAGSPFDGGLVIHGTFNDNDEALQWAEDSLSHTDWWTVEVSAVADDALSPDAYAYEALNRRIKALEAERPGRKAKPLIALRQKGVCAVSPGIDSARCPDASIYRYQEGCRGTACSTKQHAVYEQRKQSKAAAATPVKLKKRIR